MDTLVDEQGVPAKDEDFVTDPTFESLTGITLEYCTCGKVLQVNVTHWEGGGPNVCQEWKDITPEQWQEEHDWRESRRKPK